MLQISLPAVSIRSSLRSRFALSLPLRVWLILRGISFFLAAYVSTLWPYTELERTIPAWPPVKPLLLWLGRVLGAPWMRWDASYYIRIATQGYQINDGRAQFHPLYPLLASALVQLGLPSLLALFIVEILAVAALLYVFERLAQLDLESRESVKFSMMLLISRPIAVILLAPYSEALFLLCAVWSFYEARRGHWWLAGLAGGLATLTRQQGILLLLPLAWEFWTSHKRRLGSMIVDRRAFTALALIPASFALWVGYRAIVLNDFHPDLSSLSGFIYSVPISSSANQVVSNQTFIWPCLAVARALSQVWTRPDLDLICNLVLALGFLIAVGLSWRHLRDSYRIYVVAVVLISFSYYTGPVHPYMGLPRHLFLAFPVFIGLGARFRQLLTRALLISSGMAELLLMVSLYVSHAWVP